MFFEAIQGTRSRKKISEWCLLAGAAMVVALFLLLSYYAAMRQVEEDERERLQTLTNVIATDISVNLVATDNAINGIILDHFLGAEKSTAAIVSRRLRALEAAIPWVRSLAVLDPSGMIVAASRAEFIGKSFAHRQYFIDSKVDTDYSLLRISAPFTSTQNDTVITASKVIPGAGNSFGGVVVATLDPEYFTTMFKSVMYAPDVWGLVIHSTGEQLLNYPAKTRAQDPDLSAAQIIVKRHLASALHNSIMKSDAVLSDTQRLMSMSTIEPATLSMDQAIIVGLSRNVLAMTAEIRQQFVHYSFIYTFLLFLCAAWLYRTQQKREHIEALNLSFERQRQEHDERLKTALRGANLGLWQYDVTGGIFWFDDNAVTLLELKGETTEQKMEHMRQRIHSADVEICDKALHSCINGDKAVCEVTFRLRDSSGQYKWITERAQAMRVNADGTPQIVMGTYLDITTEKIVEQELVRGRNELQAVFDHMTDAVFVFDAAHNIVSANNTGKMHHIFSPSLDAADWKTQVEAFFSDGRLLAVSDWPLYRGFQGEYVRDLALEVHRKDLNTIFYLECSTAPIHDAAGNIHLLVMTLRDMTERRVTLALKESEVRFRTLIEDAPLAIAILRNGYFIYTNPRYRILHGYMRGDDLNGLAWRTMIAPDSIKRLQQVEELIASDSSIEQKFEAEGLRKGGGVIPVFKATSRVELADGPATLIFVQDISAQKHAEMEMLQARDQAEAANRSKAEFLANMSHEIRSPLNAILGLAYILEQSRLEAETYEMVSKIRSSGRTLLGIINDILDVSKIEAGQMVIEQAPFQLSELIDRLADAMSVAAAEKNIELIIQPLPAGIDYLQGDALRLEQVLTNLTSNAIKFTTVGQVELRIEVVASNANEVSLRFAVHDTGIGIATDIQVEMFSPFTQADSSTTRRFGGTGLGLAICKQMVTLMGGEIGVHSQPGVGSEFYFTVSFATVHDTHCSSPDMQTLDVLIADDSEIALDAIGSIARSLGWRVCTTDSGETLLSNLMARSSDSLPDVILLDWKMPGLDGLETARLIRQNARAGICPIVILASAYSMSHLGNQPGSELIDAILSKPVTASNLYNAVMQARQHRNSSDRSGQAMSAGAGRVLEGVSVLIVDDSEINRAVAKRILEGQSASVHMAANGKEAVEWLCAHSDEVDLVLMDVQMPVMDGIEATRLLRKDPRFDDLPIVALTAGAFKSQQDAAHAAGMNYFISKPFDVPSTIALIQRVRRHGKSAPAEGRMPVLMDSVADIRSVAEVPVLNIEKGLQLWPDMQSYRQFLHQFVADFSDMVSQVNGCLEKNNTAAAATLVHKLTGVAGNLALTALHRQAAEVERLLMRDLDANAALLRLQQEMNRALIAIDRFAPIVPTEITRQVAELPVGAMHQLKNDLQELLHALDGDSPGPAELILQTLLRQLSANQLHAIDTCLRKFDFRGAEIETLKLAREYGLELDGIESRKEG